MPYRRGRKSAAQTPAPRSERIKGSKKNPKGSAASKTSAYKIVLSDKTIKALSQKAKDYNDNHKSSVTLNTLKAVYRRGLGAYSSSHRPTITGGRPNTRNAWAMARVNKFLMKKAGKKVKAAYVQDDDLLAKGGSVYDDKELLKRYKAGKSIGFSAEAHLKAKGLLPRADGTKRKSEKYAQGGVVLYHGSPYRFENFTLEKMGEGEGAQRFGYGVYVTDLKDIANHYSLMPNKESFLVGGKKLEELFDKEQIDTLLGIWHESYIYSEKTKEELISDILLELEKYSVEVDNDIYEFDDIEQINKSARKNREMLEVLQKSDIEIVGNIYQLDVKGMDFIEYDKNISEKQASCIFSKLSQQQKKHFGISSSYDLMIFDGKGLYRALSNSYDFDTDLQNDKAASEFLLSCNINGIKYPSDSLYGFGRSNAFNYVIFDSNLINIIGVDKSYKEGGLIAPNGKPSNLTPEQYKLVRTQEFKAWFGDWENDPQSASKVVDENGEPLVVYHGSGKKFRKFDKKKIGENYFESRRGGFFFTQKKITAENYALLHSENQKGFVYECFLNIKNPIIRNTDSEYYSPADRYDISSSEYIQLISSTDNLDGIIIFGTRKDNLYIMYNPNQIKLADGTNTTFDGGNPDIRFAEGGFDDEVIICSNCLWSWKLSETTPEEKYICHKCGHDNTPTMDKITMDVPLFIRLLEFAREDAKDDMELHTMTENAVELGEKTLTMKDYDKIVFSKTTSPKITKSTNSVVEFPTIEEEFADGGVVVGKRHSESDENGTGEKFLVQSTGQIVELEGGEGVLCKESMQSKKIYKFEGKEMSGREIASFLNHKYGGVEFAEGGQVDEKSVCGCRSMYYHGGELPSATLDSLKGGEAVVTVKTMESKDKFSFQGRQMTPRKILSHINQESGGKKFEDGGIIDLTEHHLKNATKMVKMINFTEKIFYF